MNIVENISTYQFITLMALVFCALRDYKIKKITLLTSFLLFTILAELVFAKLEIKILESNLLSFNINAHGCIVFYYFLLKSKKKTIACNLVFSLWSFISLFVMVKLGIFDVLSIETYCFGLFLISLLFLKKLYQDIFIESYSNIWNDHLNWFGFAIIIFFSSSFAQLIYVRELVMSNVATSAFYRLLELANIVLSMGYLITTYVLWKNTRFTT